MCGFTLPYLNKSEVKRLITDASEIINDNGILYLSTMEDAYDKSKIISSSTNKDSGVFTYYHQEDYLSDALIKNDFKILMSHDPSHWEYRIKEDDFNYQLTLSGHTHGLQMGIEIPGFFRWSPSQYVYKQWAGLYNEFGRFINVNRGFGYHAFPGRVGIWPEITVIELKKGVSAV